MLRDWLTASRTTLRHLGRLRRLRASVAVLDQRWTHHGAHSGYLIAADSWVSLPRDCRVFPYPMRTRIASIVGDDFWEQRYLASLMLQAGRTAVLHVVDGDFDTWLYSRRPSWLSTKITATFHQPVDRLESIVANLAPGMLDGIVCVSRDQMPVVQHLVPNGRCVFIPHGVDTTFFKKVPMTEPDERPLLLSVGVHRRDFETLVAASRLVKSRRPDVRVVLVGPREKVEDVARTGVVETLSDVSDVQLRELYGRAHMLFMPLEAATANNALLEAMAAGRPAVISDLPSLHDYTGPEAALFCATGDAGAHAEAAIALLENDSLRRRMGAAARAAAERFSWPHVRSLLGAFLTKVAGA
jgi:glycosyltransferase involved in cell wall biosynthesis